MSKHLLHSLLAAALAGVSLVYAAQETPLVTAKPGELLAVLKSADASQKQKVDACRQLAVVGTSEAVATLAGLLADEKLSHMARYALEPMPYPAVDQALRDALGTVKGRLLAGVIGSLGVRRDARAVEPISKLLDDPDAQVAQAAARALGSIGNAAAARHLQNALAKVSSENRLAVCEGLFRAAEALAAAGRRNDAVKAYDALRALPEPHQVRTGGWRGAILARSPKQGLTLLREAVRSKDYLVFSAAARTAPELPGIEVTKMLSTELKELPSDNQILLMQALGKRRDPAAVPTLAGLAKSGSKPVRLTAIHAISEIGAPGPAVQPFIDLMSDADREIQQAAQEGFASLQGAEVDAAVLAMLNSRDTAQRLMAVDLIGRRRMSGNVGELLVASRDSDPKVRQAAFRQIGEAGTPNEAPKLLDVLLHSKDAQDVEAAELALGALCSKSDRPETCVDIIMRALPQAQPAQKAALLGVLGVMGGPQALKAVRGAVNDQDNDVRAAAVRTLGTWKTAEAAPDLLALARTARTPAERMQALRSYFGFADSSDVPVNERLALCRQAADLPQGKEEKRLLMAALGSINTVEAVGMIVPHLADPEIKEEAAAAVTGIAERLLRGRDSGPKNAPKLIEPLEKAVAAASNLDLAARAKAQLEQARTKAK